MLVVAVAVLAIVGLQLAQMEQQIKVLQAVMQFLMQLVVVVVLVL
jgi:hypothetical protein